MFTLYLAKPLSAVHSGLTDSLHGLCLHGAAVVTKMICNFLYMNLCISAKINKIRVNLTVRYLTKNISWNVFSTGTQVNTLIVLIKKVYKCDSLGEVIELDKEVKCRC